MDCRDIRSYVDLFIDDELELRDRVDVDKHLGLCANCHRFVRRETELRAALRAKLTPPPAPVHLRASILDAIRREPEAGASQAAATVGARFAERLRLALSWAVPAALATAIALLVVWPFSKRPGGLAAFTASAMVGSDIGRSPAAAAPNPEVRTLAPPLHRAVTLASYQGLVADVQGPEVDVRRYFEGRLPFTVTLPLVPGGNLRLIGARAVAFDSKPGAMLIYQVAEHRVTVIQTAATAEDMRSPDLVVARDGAMTTGCFVRDDRLNTVISDVDPATLAAIIDESRPDLSY